MHSPAIVRRPSVELESEEGSFQPLVTKNAHMCLCCYETTTIQDSSKCSSGKHRFCHTCLQHYVEAFVYGEPYALRHVPGSDFSALPCMYNQCQQGFLPFDVIQSVTSENVWMNFQTKIFRLAAQPDDLEARTIWIDNDLLHHIDNKEPGRDSRTVTCHAAKASNDAVHEEMRPSLEEHLCHRVEEALTEAKVRRCPKCNAAALKESGCNKLNCSSCFTTFCYVCRRSVPRRGYDHFCRHNNRTVVCSQHQCGKCPLWTTDDEDEAYQEETTAILDEANREWEEYLLGLTRLSTARRIVEPTLRTAESV